MEILLRVDDASKEEIESLLANVQSTGRQSDFVTWTRQRLTARAGTAD
ncbi:hypothetical protein [Streptomyces sp. NPDC002467]